MGRDTGSLKTWNKAVLIPVDDLVLCDWNVNEMDDPEFRALLKEVREGGFDEPGQVIPITEGDDAGKYLLLGGEHRKKVCVALEMTHMPCVIKEHLTDADEETIMMWTVRRNNIRGKINETRFAELQKRITGRGKIAAEAARRRMLIRDERHEHLKERFTQDVIDVMVDEERRAAGIGDGSSSARAPSEEVNIDGPSPDRRRPSSDDDDDDGIETQPGKGKKKAFADQRALLQNLKAFQQDVLQQSADTCTQGYLYFGIAGHTHLVVNENKYLNKLIGEMVDALKANSDSINEFLISAITKELPSWQ
ncbi:MAG: ParB N-terminal domain-containing protein [Nitrospira sp.]